MTTIELGVSVAVVAIPAVFWVVAVLVEMGRER